MGDQGFSVEQRRRGGLSKARLDVARREGREEGFVEALEEFIPRVVETVRASQELMPRVLAVLDAAVGSADAVSGLLPRGVSEDVKNVTPLAKALFDEQRRLVDRLFGSSVVRGKSEVSATVAHVSLRDLLGAQQGSGVVEGEVV